MQSKPERRKAQRHRVLKTAKLLLTSPKLTLDAVIRDVSDSGVKIQLIHEAVLPDRFEFIFVSEQVRQNARLVWQKGLLAGLELIGPKTAIKLPRVL